MTNASLTDIVGIFVILAAWVFSPELAAVVGPYLLVLVAASIGASFSLARRDTTRRLGALAYFARVCGLAVLLTVGTSVILSGLHPSLSERALIAPVALVIGFIGDDLPLVLRWAGGKLSMLIDVLIKLRGGDQ